METPTSLGVLEDMGVCWWGDGGKSPWEDHAHMVQADQAGAEDGQPSLLCRACAEGTVVVCSWQLWMPTPAKRLKPRHEVEMSTGMMCPNSPEMPAGREEA